MDNADRCVCVRDRQRCSGPFSYITVEMGFFKAFPTFLSDSRMHPGSRTVLHVLFPLHTRYLHICFVTSHMPVLAPALSLSMLCFIFYPVQYFCPLSTSSTRYSTTSLRQLALLVESFSNVTTCNVFVVRLFKALSTLVLIIQSCVVCDTLLLLLRRHHPDSFSHW